LHQQKQKTRSRCRRTCIASQTKSHSVAPTPQRSYIHHSRVCTLFRLTLQAREGTQSVKPFTDTPTDRLDDHEKFNSVVFRFCMPEKPAARRLLRGIWECNARSLTLRVSCDVSNLHITVSWLILRFPRKSGDQMMRSSTSARSRVYGVALY
jgi:hypothetical protein